MRLCKFRTSGLETRVGMVIDDSTLLDLTPAGLDCLQPVLESSNPLSDLNALADSKLPRIPMTRATLCAPVDRHEVWAAGVTYLKSKKARMDESEFSANAYDRVYDAERPEIFFKSIADKVVGPEDWVGIRRDSKWNVPEPELALVFNSKGRVVGYTIGNDMSSRDIEGENLLYLPQAKTYERSCALGPWILIGADEHQAREWRISLAIQRNQQSVFQGEISVNQLKRSFDELANALFRCQDFPHGAVLLTGTGIVPDDTFTLQSNDVISIEINGIGLLINTVTQV